MFGIKRARASKQRTQAARESERRVMAGKVAKLHGRRLAHDAATKKEAARSPAEKRRQFSDYRPAGGRNGMPAFRLRSTVPLFFDATACSVAFLLAA